MLIDASTGAPRWVVPTSTGAVEAAYDPAGRFVAVGLNDGTLQILAAADGHSLAPLLRGNAGVVYNVSVSPDGRYLAASGSPPGVTVWDTSTFTQVGTALPIDLYVPDARARFGPDGRLYTLTGGTLRVFDVDPATWLARACEVAGRTLTQAEWAELLPDRDYAPACA